MPNILLLTVFKQLSFCFIWPQTFPPGVFFSLSMWSAIQSGPLRWSFFLARQPLSSCCCKTHSTVNTDTCLPAASSPSQTCSSCFFGSPLTILTSFLSAADDSLRLLLDRGGDATAPCTLYVQTVVCTVDLGTCNSFEMAPSDVPDFRSIVRSFRSMLSSLDFPTGVFVAQSNGCIKYVLLNWTKKINSCSHSESLRIT